MGTEEIAYQNKDITSKVLAEAFKGKSFKVYGLDLPEITEVLPTNIPAVKANELRLDNLFGLADGTAALVDYESEYKEENHVKYLNYLTGIANRYRMDKKKCPVLRMVVIYTGDIKREQVSDEFNLGAVKVTVESAFLSEMDAEGIFPKIKGNIEAGESLTDEEMMEFIILPLSYRKRQQKEIKVREAVDLAAKIQDRSQQLFTLAGILAFTDKIIDRETANKIRKVIEMTQVAQIFEEEKQQALTQAAQTFKEEKLQEIHLLIQKHEKEKKQTAQKYEAEKRQVVIKLLKKGFSTEEIASIVPDFSEAEVEKLRGEL